MNILITTILRELRKRGLNIKSKRCELFSHFNQCVTIKGIDMNTDIYTNGIDMVSIIKKQRSGYLVKDNHQHTLILSNLRGYRRIGDTRSIKDWYKDSKKYVKNHPLAALLAGLSVFFGLTSF